MSHALKKNRIPYMITGGQAVLIYGEPRLTKDIDITLGVNIESLNKIKEIISRLDFKILLDEAELEDFVKKTMVIPRKGS